MTARTLIVWSACVGLVGTFAAAQAPTKRSVGAPSQFVRAERIAQLTSQLVRINSEYEYQVVNSHKETAQFLADELRAMNLAVEVVGPSADFPVVVGRLRGSGGGRSLGFATHYNTVKIGDRSKWSFDPFSGEYRDGKVFGRGSANSKGSVASDIEAARAVIESGVKLRGDLLLVFMPGEGATEFSMPWIVKNRPDLIKADWYMGGGGGGNFTRMHAGHQWFKVIVKGTMAHPPCNPPNCVNAAAKLMKVLPAVIAVDDWLTWKSDPSFGNRKPTADVGKIVAGYEVNIIPDRAEADIDLRTVPTQTYESVRRDLEVLLARLKEEDPALNMEVQWIHKDMVPYQSWFDVKDDDPLVQAIKEIAPAYTGRTPEWSAQLGGGGGRPDLHLTGAKVIYFGIGGGRSGGAHSYDEWVAVDGLVKNSMFEAELIARFLR